LLAAWRRCCRPCGAFAEVNDGCGPLSWLWTALLLAGTIAYTATILVHWTVGYHHLKHLLPAYGGLALLWLGSALSYRHLAAADARLDTAWRRRLALAARDGTTLSTANLFDDLPDELPEESIETLVQGKALRVERIVSQGHSSPADFWYDQPEDEWVMVVRGKALLRFEDQDAPVTLEPGDHLLIPAHRRHRVEWTSGDPRTVWLAVFFRDD
jgi:cupin 2 domain-containing protein